MQTPPQATDAQRLTDEYRRLVDGFQGQGVIPRNNEGWLANPVLPDDILREAVCIFFPKGTKLKQF